MNKKGLIATAVGALLAAPALSTADVGLGAKLGTLGAGVELTKDVTRKINGRVGVNVLTYDTSGSESDVDYTIDLELSSVTAILDWHPFGGGVRVSAGVAFNGNELSMVGKPTNTSYTIGDTTYTPSEVGTLRGNVTFDDVTPYLGIGWGNAVSPNDRFTFSLDVGVLFQGDTTADLTADGTLASDPTFQAELAKEEQNLNEALDDFELYPVLSVGFAYRF